MRNESIFDAMAQDINCMNIPEADKQRMMKNLAAMRSQKMNIMITGATGCGKSSTINALFDSTMAKVGEGADPETMSIEKYEYGNLILWDSPGLGDGAENDVRHSKNIISKLHERDENGNLLIDLVLVILDGGSRDLGTSYDLINNVIIPNLGEERDKRILVAINQADMAMKGKYWNITEHRPEPRLEEFLQQKAESVKSRIFEATGVTVEPICYSAGYTENGIQEPPYNLSKLLLYIIRHTPSKKRILLTDPINPSKENFRYDDELRDYNEEVRKSLGESIRDGITEGVDIGSDLGGAIGGIFGRGGETIGRAIGGILGGIVGAVGGFLGGLFG